MYRSNLQPLRFLPRARSILLSSAFCTAAMVSIGLQGSDDTKTRGKLIIIRPSLAPLEQGSAACTSELAALATAETYLEDAHQAWQEAYEAWYDCEMEAEFGQPVANPIGPAFSILER